MTKSDINTVPKLCAKTGAEGKGGRPADQRVHNPPFDQDWGAPGPVHRPKAGCFIFCPCAVFLL